MVILANYERSIFHNFESFLKTENHLVKDDIRLGLDESNSSFITYELELGIYTFKDLFKTLFINLQPEYELFNNSQNIEVDDLTMKT